MTEEPYFHAAASGELQPVASAHAPWSTDMLHGRLVGGIGARAIESVLGASALRVARLTVDLFRPAGMGPVSVRAEPVREGRRIRVVDAIVSSGGNDIARVTAVALAPSENPPGRIWQPATEAWPAPDTLKTGTDAGGWELRMVEGGMGTAERTRIWTNDTRPLVEGEEMSPLVRTAVSGDIACPLANSSDEGLHYINADYTLAIAGYPVGPWLGLGVTQQLASEGISVASCTLVDELGPFATSTGSSLTTAPMPVSGASPASD